MHWTYVVPVTSTSGFIILLVRPSHLLQVKVISVRRLGISSGIETSLPVHREREHSHKPIVRCDIVRNSNLP